MLTGEFLKIMQRSSSRRPSVSTQMAESTRNSNFDSLRHDVDDCKDMIKRMYKQIDSYDEKREHLNDKLEELKRANKTYSVKVKDLLDVFKNPPSLTTLTSLNSTGRTTSSSKYGDHLDVQNYSYSSNRSSRSSSRSGNVHPVFDNDDDFSSEDESQERNFTKSIDGFDMDSTDA